jgi:hypothetical protein
LIAAASADRADHVRVLLDCGASVEGARSVFGDLLQTVRYLGQLSVLEVLLEKKPVGLDWSVKMKYGEDLLALAARSVLIPTHMNEKLKESEKIITLLNTKVEIFRGCIASRAAVVTAV